MAVNKVRKYLKKWGKEKDVLEFDVSIATVELAAKALGVEPARIAKTISFKSNDGAMLIVAAGDAKTDNKKFRSKFGFKAKMLTPEENLKYIGYAVGGVCPFDVKDDIPVFLDVSLKRFKTIFPSCGSSNSAIELTCEELELYSLSKEWVDVCKGWE